MSQVTVLTTTAPSLDKLKRELGRLFDGCAADDVIAISHSTDTVSIKRSGGVWGPSSQTERLEYSAVVLVRGR